MPSTGSGLRRELAISMAVAASLALIGCVGNGDVTARVSGQIVGVDERPLGPGLVLIEKGKVQQGAYQIGTRISELGQFSADLSDGGTWGLHIFHPDYTYLPLEITIEPNQQVVLTSSQAAWGVWLDLTGLPTWPDQPSDSTLVRLPWDDNVADNPEILDVRMSYPEPGLLDIELDATDPNGDLARLILAYDTATGAGFALNPPGPPNALGDYPNGTYTLTIFLDERHEPGASTWFFVVSDHLCNNSMIVEMTMPPL